MVVRRSDGSPVVLANGPFLDSGRPMPTRFWLIDRALVKAIGRLESTGAVDRVEAAIDPEVLQATHDAYAAERDALIPPDQTGPRPFGGVGGTRIGVKCLHAHYANLLVGADDPVGRWVDERLAATGDAFDATTSARLPDVTGPAEPEAGL